MKGKRSENGTHTKYVYFFGAGKADGTGKMKDVLGGKGAGLAEMTNAGLPVPPGFTIQTEACREYLKTGKTSDLVDLEIGAALAHLEALTGEKLGDKDRPLLLSVRSGSKFSMPGMMDTILDLGLNEVTVEALALRAKSREFAYDCYRRFIAMFGHVVLGIEKRLFTRLEDQWLNAPKPTEKIERLERLVRAMKALVYEQTEQAFPDDPQVQLSMARDAVFRSWNSPRAKTYRRISNISNDLGTAVTVQKMVFGNLGEKSATGVAFTRNPATGEKVFYGEFLINAQGEEVVAGIRTPQHITEMASQLPATFDQLSKVAAQLEKHFRDVQDFEFTVEEGTLYMLQTRNGKRTGRAAVKIALDMVDEKLIAPEEALFRVEAAQLYDFLLPRIDPAGTELTLLTKGLPASPGAAVGKLVFTAEDAVQQSGPGKEPVILVRAETTPEDIHGIDAAAAILTSRGGMTSHAAVVTRGLGKTCVVGAQELSVDEAGKKVEVNGHILKEGDWISLDGSVGHVYLGKATLLAATPDDPLLSQFMKLADPARRLHVRSNADIPRDAANARAFGAEGIGLCRTEHMFFAPDRIPHMRTMIMASNEQERRAALQNLLPLQREDFTGLFKVMAGQPVTIRLLDPPLHEFLPAVEELKEQIAELQAADEHSERIKKLEETILRAEALRELNPMLGHRGCRLGITYPEITEMQARAIFEAAISVAQSGGKVEVEVMIPLVSTVTEFRDQAAVVRRVADEVFHENEFAVPFLVGTMIELPRACMVASDIAKEADFFSFGTNDLTQTTFGFSRDDIGRFLPIYLEKGILPQDPFAVIDREGVGRLIHIAVQQGRAANPKLHIGICGEHGGDPSSIEFCEQLGLDYVSCSPFRVLTAKLAAAQAAAAAKVTAPATEGTR